LAKLGVVGQQIPGGEVYSSLEKGTIDAAEWVGPYDDEKLGFYKVAPFYYAPGWWEGAAAIHLFFNTDKWDSLPPAYKGVVRSAAAMSNMWMTAKYDAENPPALKRMIANGAQVRVFSPQIMEACLKASNEVYAEISAENPEFKKIWDNMLAFRNLQYEWWQVAEYNFDNFMVRSRPRG
jgi:TRAP-type mannitol/chloroaromatic compound transport system substrate-binding protein